jgi:hypothetical protein
VPKIYLERATRASTSKHELTLVRQFFSRWVLSVLLFAEKKLREKITNYEQF